MIFLPRPRLLTEDRFLLALLRGESPDPAASLTPEVWDRLLHRGRVHRVEPHLLNKMHHLPAGVLPEAVADRVVRLRRAWSIRSMEQDLRAQRILSALNDTGLVVLVLKGPALAQKAFADPALRADVADLDLFIPPQHHSHALATLRDLGYDLRDPDLARRYHRPFHMHDVLVDHRNHILELHWALSRPDDLFSLDADDFLAHAGGGPPLNKVRWSSPTDLLLHTAAQSLGDGFAHLRRLLDADGLLRRQAAEIDWDRLLHQAQRGGLLPSLWLLLEMTRELLETPVERDKIPAPARPARWALASLEPGVAMAGTFAARHSSLRHLYTFWLVSGPWRHLRAAVRLVRLSSMQVARRPVGTSVPARMRSTAGRLVTLCKLAGYQTLCLARRLLGRRHSAHQAHLKVPWPPGGPDPAP